MTVSLNFHKPILMLSSFTHFTRRYGVLVALVLISSVDVLAQARTLGAGATAITGVATGLATYIAPLTNVCYIVAALIGIVGGVKVYSSMSSGDQMAGKLAAQWFGAAIFLIMVPTIINGLFIA